MAEAIGTRADASRSRAPATWSAATRRCAPGAACSDRVMDRLVARALQSTGCARSSARVKRSPLRAPLAARQLRVTPTRQLELRRASSRGCPQLDGRGQLQGPPRRPRQSPSASTAGLDDARGGAAPTRGRPRRASPAPLAIRGRGARRSRPRSSASRAPCTPDGPDRAGVAPSRRGPPRGRPSVAGDRHPADVRHAGARSRSPSSSERAVDGGHPPCERLVAGVARPSVGRRRGLSARGRGARHGRRDAMRARDRASHRRARRRRPRRPGSAPRARGVAVIRAGRGRLRRGRLLARAARAPAPWPGAPRPPRRGRGGLAALVRPALEAAPAAVPPALQSLPFSAPAPPAAAELGARAPLRARNRRRRERRPLAAPSAPARSPTPASARSSASTPRCRRGAAARAGSASARESRSAARHPRPPGPAPRTTVDWAFELRPAELSEAAVVVLVRAQPARPPAGPRRSARARRPRAPGAPRRSCRCRSRGAAPGRSRRPRSARRPATRPSSRPAGTPAARSARIPNAV